jgi:hypothetical protein
MKLYLLTYDNGEDYEMNDQKPIAIFDNYETTKAYVLSKGFNETESCDFFIRDNHLEYTYLKHRDYMLIDEFELNTPEEI